MKNSWTRLDNAAKIFPAAAHKSDSQVFRMVCELTEPVQPVILQQALDDTIEAFPIFRHVMKHGFFWYYLESTDLKPEVHIEHRPPCAPIYDKDRKSLLFEVTYYHYRINLDVYHVLTDGTGATQFLTALVTKYLSLLLKTDEPVLPYDASHTQMNDDSFSKYSSGHKPPKPSHQENACKLRGQKYSEDRLGLISGVVSVNEVKAAAKRHNVSVTVFLCACMLNSISASLSVRAKKKPVVLSVPVNLRNVFPSESARNFFSVLPVSYHYSKESGALEDVAASLSKAFSEGLTEERLAANMNNFAAIERNPFARVTPLFLKDMILRAAYRLSRRKVTAALSNVGIVRMPDVFADYVRTFYLFSGTDGLQACVCSFGDRLSVGFTSSFVSTEIQRHFFRTLREMGMEVELTANIIDD